MIFASLANRTNLAIIDTLKNGSKSIGQINKVLDQEETVVTNSLKMLTKCAITISQGKGKDTTYSLNKELLEPLSELIAFHVDKYCPGFKECISPEKLKEYMKTEAAKITYIEHE